MTVFHPRFQKNNPVHWLAFGLGSGLSPKAPGTMGSLLAVLLYLPLAMLEWQWYLLVLVVGFWAGCVFCELTSRDLQVHDHGGIVWDEFIGQWLALLPLVLLGVNGWVWLLAGFGLFRFFDVLKPWPIRWLDRHVHGGFGIMIDDVLAGVMGALALWAGLVWLA